MAKIVMDNMGIERFAIELEKGQIAIITKHTDPKYIGTYVIRTNGDVMVCLQTGSSWSGISLKSIKVRTVPVGHQIVLEQV